MSAIYFGICYSSLPSILEGSTDTSWNSHRKDYTASTSWIFIIIGDVVSWGSKKHLCQVDCTMAAKFIASASTTKAAEWSRDLHYEILLWPKPISAILIRSDNEATVPKAYSQVRNGKNRHVGLQHSIVKQHISDSLITISYVSSSQFLEDPFTKGLMKDLVSMAFKRVGLKVIK